MVAILLFAGSGIFAGCGKKDIPIKKLTPDQVCQRAIEASQRDRLKKACPDNVKLSATIGVASDLQKLMTDLGSLISLASGLGKAPAFAPEGELDAGGILKNMLNKIMIRLKKIKERAVESSGEPWAKLVVNFKSVELALNISDLIKNSSEKLPKNLKINLAGEWNRVELVALGGVSAGLLGLLDAVLAHNIKLDLDTLSVFKDIDLKTLKGLTTSAIAGFVVANPNLLTMNSTTKLKEASTELQIMLDLVAGKANAGAGKEGLLAILDEQLTKDPDQSDNLIEIIDNGTKGQFDKGDIFVVKAVEKTIKSLKLDPPPKNPGQLPNKYISRASLDDVTDLGRAINTNLSGADSTPISLNDYLANAWVDLKAYTGNDKIEDPQAWLAIAPKKFFDTAKPIRAYLPGIYAVNVSSTATDGEYTRFDGSVIETKNQDGSPGTATDIVASPLEVSWEFALECELAYSAADYAVTTNTGIKGKLDGNSGWRIFCGAGTNTGAMASKAIAFGVTTVDTDPGHFDYQVIAGSPAISPVTNSTFLWATDLGPIAAFDADGQFPLGVSPVSADGLPILGLQDPSIGGLLLVDPLGAGTFADATNATFNETLAVIYNTYIDDIDQGVTKVKNDLAGAK